MNEQKVLKSNKTLFLNNNNSKTLSPNTLLASSISNNTITINSINNGQYNKQQQHHNSLLLTNHNEIDLSSMDDNEKKIILEFLNLQEKSRVLFNGLRELPQYGHKTQQWQAYFGRTFDVYTKLWKFQQQHRQLLDLKYNYKRWQIGEMASKIGQLYYHY